MEGTGSMGAKSGFNEMRCCTSGSEGEPGRVTMTYEISAAKHDYALRRHGPSPTSSRSNAVATLSLSSGVP